MRKKVPAVKVPLVRRKRSEEAWQWPCLHAVWRIGDGGPNPKGTRLVRTADCARVCVRFRQKLAFGTHHILSAELLMGLVYLILFVYLLFVYDLIYDMVGLGNQTVGKTDIEQISKLESRFHALLSTLDYTNTMARLGELGVATFGALHATSSPTPLSMYLSSGPSAPSARW